MLVSHLPLVSEQTLEREIKLPFESAEAARAAVLATGATPLHGRRLQEDSLLDTANDDLRRRRSALRVRQDVARGFVSARGALEDYGVVLDPVTLEPDKTATEAERARRAGELPLIDRGPGFAEAEARWRARRG